MPHACHCFGHATKPSRFAHFCNPLRLPRESTSQRPKVLRARQFFTLLTSKRASRHDGAHFFDTSTSKCGPSMVCFVHFDLERKALRATSAYTCSTSQLPSVLRTWSVFSFSLANVLCATTACNFLSLIWPDGSPPAALASLLFDPPEPQIIGKTVFRDFATFSGTCIFFPLSLSLLWSSLFCSSLLWLCPPLLFHLSILSEVWLLNFIEQWVLILWVLQLWQEVVLLLFQANCAKLPSFRGREISSHSAACIPLDFGTSLFLGIEGLNIYPNTTIHHVINKYRCYNLCWSIAPSLVSGDDGCVQQLAIGLSLGNPNFQWLWVNNSW